MYGLPEVGSAFFVCLSLFNIEGKVETWKGNTNPVMEEIIYIYPNTSTFVRQDIRVLSKTFVVKSPNHNWTKKGLVPLLFIKQFFFLLVHMHAAKAVIVMFGGYWSFLPALLGHIFNKPVFIILGGMDCVSFPAIDYGGLRKPLVKIFIKWSYQLCTRLLPVHESLVITDYTYVQSAYPKQGFKYFFPSIKTSYQTIYNGYNINFWNEPSGVKRSNTFITIAAIEDEKRLRLKGADVFVQLAKIFPQYSFTIVGVSDAFKKTMKELPSNLTVHAFLAPENFKHLLGQSEFYLQLSLSEGFPNSLCEAMLCGCIPVGSSVGAIPLIIGNTGVVIRKFNFDVIKDEIIRLISLNKSAKKELSLQARNRIASLFPIENRERAFIRLINSYAEQQKSVRVLENKLDLETVNHEK